MPPLKCKVLLSVALSETEGVQFHPTLFAVPHMSPCVLLQVKALLRTTREGWCNEPNYATTPR